MNAPATLERLSSQLRRAIPDRRNLKSDLIAGLTCAVVGVPQAMAHASLQRSIQPSASSLWWSLFPLAPLFTSSVFINVSSTAAMSVAAGAIMMDFSVGQRMEAPAVAANAWLDKSPTSAGAGHKAEHTDLLRNSIEGD